MGTSKLSMITFSHGILMLVGIEAAIEARIMFLIINELFLAFLK